MHQSFKPPQIEVETLWMPSLERDEMEANLRMISRKISKAQDLLRKMRSRWDLFREKYKLLVPLVHDRCFLRRVSYVISMSA